jgi:hypothetical protein
VLERAERKFYSMTAIPDKDRSIFKDAAMSVLDNFTFGELAELEIAGSRISEIIKRAQDGQQQTLKGTA